MAKDIETVVVPRELYYHEVAYVRGLEKKVIEQEAEIEKLKRFIRRRTL